MRRQGRIRAVPVNSLELARGLLGPAPRTWGGGSWLCSLRGEKCDWKPNRLRLEAPPLLSWVTLGLGFLICKMGIIIVPVG